LVSYHNLRTSAGIAPMEEFAPLFVLVLAAGWFLGVIGFFKTLSYLTRLRGPRIGSIL
jgi:hypothetical protein